MKRRLWIAVVALLFASCESAPAGQSLKPEESLWTAPLACLLYGLVAGLTIAWLYLRLAKKKPGKNVSSNNLDREIKEARDAAQRAELGLLHKEVALTAAQSESRELQRKVDELERLIRPAITEQVIREHPADEVTAEVADIYYFLQPTTDGRFTQAGAVAREADALYALCPLPGKPEEASLSFIDTPGNVALAIQNEASWILVACERSNIATASTRSIRTETPGRVAWKVGEWVIMQKAKIVYQ